MTQLYDLPWVFYVGDGATVTFPYPYKIALAQELQVYQDSLLVSTYTVAGVGNPAGGSITFLAPPSAGVVIGLFRLTARTQLVDYIANDPFSAETHEAALDKLTRQIQDLLEPLTRAPQLPLNTTNALRQSVFPPPGPSAVVGWNADGTALTLYEVAWLRGSQGPQGPPGVSPFFQAAQFGAVGDGVADDTAALQQAIDTAGAGGQTLIINSGVYKITETLTVPYSNISILGEATGYLFQGSPATTGTVLKWAGPVDGLMMDMAPASPGPPYLLFGNRLENLIFDSGGTTGTTLLISSVTSSAFRNLTILGGTDAALVVNVRFPAADGFSLTDHCEFSNLYVCTTGAAVGILLDGWPVFGGYAPTFCNFTNCSVVHEDGVAFLLAYCDDVFFFNCSASRVTGGTGDAIFFGGSNDGSFRAARSCMFLCFNGQGDIHAQGLAGWSDPSVGNFVLLSSMDTPPIIHIDAGASLYYVDTGGYSVSSQARMRLPGLEAAEVAPPLPDNRTAVKLLGGTGGGGPFISVVGGDQTSIPIMACPLELASYALGDLPVLALGNDGAIAYCTNLAGGRGMVYFDGATLQWKRVADGTVVS